MEKPGYQLFNRQFSHPRHLIVLFLLANGIAGAEILLSSQLGNSWDPLVGVNPLFVSPSETMFSEITANNNPFAAPFIGPVRLQVECCKDALSKQSTANPGIAFQITPSKCRVLTLAPGAPRPGRLPAIPDPTGLALPICPSPAQVVNVNVSAVTAGTAFLRVTASSTATPTTIIATLRADWAGQTVRSDIFVSIVPSTWPADGPQSPCTLVTPVSQASISPPPFTWKRSHLSSSPYTLGASFSSSNSTAGAGMEFTATTVSTTGPIPSTISVVSFTNHSHWPVAVRTIDSRSCGTPGQQAVVPSAGTATISFNSGTTTTLVFMKSTCRAWIDAFDCWGQSALGLDDLVVLTEGPFWLLFGGRKLTLETVGEWGALPRADSTAVIHTP